MLDEVYDFSELYGKIFLLLSRVTRHADAREALLDPYMCFMCVTTRH